MMHHRTAALLCSFAVLATAGCELTRRSGPSTEPSPIVIPSIPTGPTGATNAFVGTWRSIPTDTQRTSAATNASIAATVPDLRDCTDFAWTITSQTETSVSGTFSVSCAGSITLTATGTGAITSTSAIDLTVNGTGNMPGLGACAFTLNGTGVLLDAETLKIDYTGTTCLGPVSGTQKLYKDLLFPPAETPDPPSNPTPPSSPAPSGNPCASNDGRTIVNCVAARYPDYLSAGVSTSTRIRNMEFLRDRVIEAGVCGGLDLAWNLKRGVGPHSIDAIAWKHANGFVDVVDLGQAYDDTSRPLRLTWNIVDGPPGYDPYPHPGC